MFKGRKLLIATKHGKESVIAPILEKELGVECFIISNFNTDELGTFTGEVERKDDPFTTVKNKCLQGMAIANCDLAVSSEGSFGAHPTIFFVPANDEVLVLMDMKNNLEISVREISTNTNFGGAEILSIYDLKEFANKAKFPSHGLILRKTSTSFLEIEKGITDWELLIKIGNQFIEKYGSVYVETDMRAMLNPTRMGVIEIAAQKLANKINTICPSCSTPGFGITDLKKGLPCELCRFPSQSTLFHIYTCQKCSFTKEIKYPNKKKTEDPMYCNICNP